MNDIMFSILNVNSFRRNVDDNVDIYLHSRYDKESEPRKL